MATGAVRALCLGLLIVFATLPALVCYRTLPGRDSGGALYAGWRILQGDVLYRDAWDHKAPAIYCINALGLLLGGGSTWGVAGLELLLLLAAAMLGWSALRDAFGAAPAFFATVAWIFTLSLVHDGGNLPEGYALPLQFAALYLFARSDPAAGFSARGMLIGASGGLAFCIRPNLAGIWCAILLCVALRAFRRGRVRPGAAAAVLAGGALTLLPFALCLAARGALPDALEAVFVYNRAYAAATMRDRLAALARGWRLMRVSGLSLTALLGWCGGCVFLRGGGAGEGTRGALVQCAVVAFPIELAAASVSGRAYPHYYMAWLPVFAVLSGFLAYAVLRAIPLRFAASGGEAAGAYRVRGLALFALLAVMAGGPVHAPARRIALFRSAPETAAKRTAVDYLRTHTGPDETVLVWGAEPSVNFLSRRKSPSRYSFQYPLYTNGYRNAAAAAETFLAELSSRPPAVVIDTSATNLLVPPLDPASRRRRRLPSASDPLPPAMGKLFDLLAARYRRVDGTGVLHWAVYRQAGR